MAKAASSINTNTINVPVTNHNKLKDYMEIAFNNRIALMMHGTFGIGKSAIVKQFAKKKAAELKLEYSDKMEDVNDPKKFVAIVINLHQFDVSGFWLPVFVDGKYTQQINDMFPVKGNGIIFFDEINLAPNMVQANAYQFILDRRLGKYAVPDGYAVFAAGNTTTDNAHIHEMATPLKNRMMHFQLNVPTAEEWANNYAVAAGIDHRIVNFLLFAEHYMHKYNPDITENVFGIPTPRSWEFTSQVIKGIAADGDSKGTLYDLVAANVGKECAREFAAFVCMSQDINTAEIFKKGDMKVPEAIDQIYALMSALIAYYMKKPETISTFVKLSFKFKPEHTVILIKQAKVFNPAFIDDLKAADPELLKKFAREYAKYVM